MRIVQRVADGSHGEDQPHLAAFTHDNHRGGLSTEATEGDDGAVGLAFAAGLYPRLPGPARHRPGSAEQARW